MTTATAPTKTRYPRLLALSVAEEIMNYLEPACVRILPAGSFRRERQFVGDLEILYIPRTETRPDPSDFFSTLAVSLADEAISIMESGGILARRHNSKGSEMFGALNKLMLHVQTGIPVDLFATTEESWFNYLVCRTGPADLNQRIATAAMRKNWRWNPYGRGFSRGALVERMDSEEDVFRFVGLTWKEPRDRA